MTIYDGGSFASPVVDKFCGTSVEGVNISTSSSNEILVYFESDDSDNGPGFKLEYKSIGELLIFEIFMTTV